jgi:hypothetical protein
VSNAMRTPTILLAVIAAIAAISFARPARADDKSDAEMLFRAGEKAFDAGQYGAASDAFEQAYAKLPLPAIAFSTAQAYRLQYFIDKQPMRLKRAVELYHAYIDTQKSGGRVTDAASNLAQLEPLLQQMQAAGANMTAPMPPRQTRLMVMADVDGARAKIDGTEGAAPLVQEVKPGEHTVEVTADGYFPVTVKAKAIDGEMTPVDVQLKPKPALLDVSATDGAHVTVDGRPLGTTPITGAEVPAGQHLVTITPSGHVPDVREIVLAYGKTATIDTELRTTTQRKVARVVVVGAGVLAIATGLEGIATLSVDSDAGKLHDQLVNGGLTPADLTRYDTLRARRDDRVRNTEVLGGFTAAIAITGVLMYVFDDPSPEGTAPLRSDDGAAAKKKIEIEPMIGPTGGAGVTIRGSF